MKLLNVIWGVFFLPIQNTYINKIKRGMRTGNRRLKSLVRECVENDDTMPQVSHIALLSMQDIVDIIILTIAALNGGEYVPVVSESQKEKGRPLNQRYPASRKLRHS